MVVLAAPVLANIAFADAIAGALAEGAIVTDMGSTKGEFCRRVSAAHPEMCLVGSHPVAGSEKQGAGAARADLFVNRRCVVTPLPGTPEAAVACVEALWHAVGAYTIRMSPEEHEPPAPPRIGRARGNHRARPGSGSRNFLRPRILRHDAPRRRLRSHVAGHP